MKLVVRVIGGEGLIHEFTGATMRRVDDFYTRLLIVIGDAKGGITEFTLDYVACEVDKGVMSLVSYYRPEKQDYFLKVVLANPDCERLYELTKKYQRKLLVHSDGKVVFQERKCLSLEDDLSFAVIMEG